MEWIAQARGSLDDLESKFNERLADLRSALDRAEALLAIFDRISS